MEEISIFCPSVSREGSVIENVLTDVMCLTDASFPESKTDNIAILI